MNLTTFLQRGLWHYWRTNLAVVLGVIAATAVIGGALLVGDSVRDSLRQMTLDRLGQVDHALVGQRFFREALITEMQADLPEATALAPAIVVPGSLNTRASGDGDRMRRAGRVNLYGVDDRFWKLANTPQIVPSTAESSLVVNERLADQLALKVGDDVSVVVEIPAAIPRDSLLGEREETSTELLLTVSAIAPDRSMPGRFGLNPTQHLPLNAFIPLDLLQRQMGLGEVQATPRNPVAKPARVNAIFAGTGGDTLGQRESTALTGVAAQHVTLTDLGLRIKPHAERGYASVESERMILEDSLSTAARTLVAPERTSASLIYLLNELRSSKQPERYGMYSVAAGVEFSENGPFGPFEYLSGTAPQPDDDEGVVLNEWSAKDLGVGVGDEIDVKYHVVGDRGELPEAETSFTVRGIVKIAGPAADRGFAPDVPGVTDADSYADWREPFPLKRDLITPRDDEYWEEYKTTPKVFLSLKAAQKLWQSRYGQLTSVRIAPAAGQDLDALAKELDTKLLQHLSPDDTGLRFAPVKEQGLQASEKSGDFTGLFLGFSFFLILAAALLIGLLFRLGIEKRIREFGLLSALGWSPGRVRRAFLSEGAILVLFGVVAGTGAAIGYAALMMHGLRTWWIGAVGTRFLFLSVHPVTLLIGAAISVAVSILAVLWGLRQARFHSTRAQLAGANEATQPVSPHAGRWSRPMAFGGLAVAGFLLLAALLGWVPQSEAFGGFSWQIVAFFLTGICALVGSLALFAWWLTSEGTLPVQGHGVMAVARLGLRNASRHRSRSLLTASLLASAVFVVVAVATGQRNPAVEQPVRESGNGGFTLVAETNTPLLYDLNTSEGRANLGLNLAQDSQVASRLEEMHVAAFRVKPGEDASCLNIYRTSVPTILGVPQATIEEFTRSRRFKFADTRSPEPWRLLDAPLANDRIPVLGDMNTLMYSLHKGIGDTIALTGENQPEQPLEVVGMFDGSIFQGVLLMSEEPFRRLFPDAGYQFFLIESPPEHATEVSSILESQLNDAGFDAERVADRLADFLAVQNTYLSTFQTLGGLGLLLGTIGLATVMLRNVLERRGELALMRAVGFTDARVGGIVLCENVFLLLVGVACGGGAALLAMTPHLSTVGANVPWMSLGLLGIAVVTLGALSAAGAVWEALRTPIVATLRSE